MSWKYHYMYKCILKLKLPIETEVCPYSFKDSYAIIVRVAATAEYDSHVATFLIEKRK